jgi:hypothetical protein
MKTNDTIGQQSAYRLYGEENAKSGAPQQATSPESTSPGRNRRSPSPAPPGWYDKTGGATAPPPISQTTNSLGGNLDAVTQVRLQGVQIKTDYTAKEVLTIAADAFSRPITAFLEYMGNAGSLLIDGRPATEEEKHTIRSFTEKFDAITGAAGGGSIQAVGKMLHHINDAANGKMPSRDEIVANMMDGVNMIDVKIPDFKGKVLTRSDPPPPSGPDAPPPASASKPAISQAAKPAPVQNETPTNVVKELSKQGPLVLPPSLTRREDQQRIDGFGAPVTFYRKDRAVPNPDAASPLRATDYRDRRGVLMVGKGKDLTSYDPGMRAVLNRNRSADVIPALANADVIALRSGKDGVAAINVNFADLAPGSTTVVTSGAMRGDMTLFTADDSGFSAYRAQASKRIRAQSADTAAASIASAHERFGQTDTYAKPPASGFDALFRAATSHPFSALVYSYDVAPEGHMHPKFGPTSDVGLRPDGRPWSSVNFNYLAPGQSPNEVGTAQAVIVKDLNGKVTVRVLAQRGKLENGIRGPHPSFTYRPIESAVGSFTTRDRV